MSNPTADKNKFYIETYFNETEYTAGKAAALNHEKYNGRIDWTADEVKKSFEDQNITAYEHFHRHGAYEKDVDGKIGINPSKLFDVSRYYEDKIAKAKLTMPEATQDMLYSQLKNDGLDAITHFAIFGQSEYVNPRLTNIGRTEYSDYTKITPTNDWRIDKLHELNHSDLNKMLAQNNNTVYYSFMETDIQEQSGFEKSSNFIALNDNQRIAVKQVTEQITAITGIKFEAVENGDKVNLYFYTAASNDSWGWSDEWNSDKKLTGIALSNSKGHGADELLDPRMGENLNGFHTLTHEMGHFLGLGHISGRKSPSGNYESMYNQYAYTTMAIDPLAEGNETWYSPTKSYNYYSPYDLAVLSWLYGTDGIGGNEGLVYRAASAPQNAQLDTMGVDTMGVGDMPLA